MEALFVHGGEKLKKDNQGKYYTGSSYSQGVWNRYLNVFGNLTTIFRQDQKVYTSSYANKHFQIFDDKRVSSVLIPDISSSLLSFFNFKKRIRNLETIEEAVLKCDCLIVRLPSNASLTAIKFAIKYGKPYLIEVVGCPWDTLWNHSYKGKMLAFSRYLSMKKAVKKSSYVVYVTNNFLQSRYPTSGKNISCSDVLLPPIDSCIKEKRLKKIESRNINSPIILGTTAVVNLSYKGQQYVIEAISKLNRIGYNFEYHLVGEGDPGNLRNLASAYGVAEKVKFLGSIPHNQVFDFLDDIDIYIQPSKTEGLPRGLIEAMSRGCPSLGSNKGGIPELLNKDFVFQSGNVKDICEILKKIDKVTMAKEANRSIEVAASYTQDVLEEKRLKFYKSFSEGDIN